jgi:hypothetical protein
VAVAEPWDLGLLWAFGTVRIRSGVKHSLFTEIGGVQKMLVPMKNHEFS